MCARTDPNMNLLKKNYEDRSPRPPEPKRKQKRKRLGEMYITTDRLDRLTLQASTFQTHSDEELPLKSHCLRHLTSRAGPSVHLCWQFDDAHRAEEKSGELISAINKVVKILKSLDADDDEYSGSASDVQNGVASGDASEINVPLEKEPERDYDTKGNDFDSMNCEHFGSPERERSGPGTPRPECEASASRVEETICDRNAGELVLLEKGCESCESAGSQCVSFLHSSALKSVYQAPDDHQPEGTLLLLEDVHEPSGEEESVLHSSALKSVYQAPVYQHPEDTMLKLENVHEPSGEEESVLHSSALKSVYQAPDGHQHEDTMQLENVHECSGQEVFESKCEGLATEPADDAFTLETKTGPDSACESEGQISDCEIENSDSDAPPGSEKQKSSDTEPISDEEMNKASLYRDERPSEERGTPDLRIRFHGLEINAECPVHFQFEEDECPAPHHSVLDDQTIGRENLSICNSDLEGKVPANTIEGADKRGDTYFLQLENPKESSSESSLLYEDERVFHDSVRELKRNSSKSHEVFSMGLKSGGDHFPNSKVYHDYDETNDLAKRKEASRYRRVRRLRHATEIVTLPEVDRIFSGEKWKTLDPRVRVKTILDQFHYLVNYFRFEGLEREKVKGCRGRPDILAGKYLMAKRFCFNQGWSMVGNIPGVEVGDTFMYREELLILIVHRTSQAGIEYIPASKSGFVDNNGCPAAVAVSVVSAGGYRDTEDDGETMTYIGSGGQRNMTHTRCSSEYVHGEKDQELVRGNLALKNSCDLGVPVRMIRGERNFDGEVMKKSYWYDGLYDVTKCYEEKGSAGSKVWKFQLVKQKGQRES